MLKIYKTNTPYFTEFPLVIIASKEDGDNLFGEYYVLLNDVNQSGFWQRISAKKSQMINPYIAVNEDYIFNEAKDVAMEKLHVHQSELHLRTMGDVYTKTRYEYSSEVDLKEVTRIILRKNYLGIFGRIKDQTKNDELKAYLTDICAITSIKFESL